MAQFNVAQTSFSRGYLSKRLAARTDIEEYFQSCEKVSNFVPLPQGGMKKRDGTKYYAPITLENPLASIMFSHFDGKMGELVGVISLRNTATDTPIEMVRVWSGVSFIDQTGVSNIAKQLINAMLADTTVKVRTASMGQYLLVYTPSGLISPVLVKFEFVSGATTLKISADAWFDAAFTDLPASWARTPYRALTCGTITVLGLTTSPTYTYRITTERDCFTDSSVGQIYRVDDTTTGASLGSYFVKVLTFTNAKQVVVEQIRGYNLAAGSSLTMERIYRSYWGPETGWPRCYTTFQQRSVFASTFESPDTFFGSHVQNRFMFITQQLVEDAEEKKTELAYAYNFFGGVKNSDPFAFNISSDYETAIEWVCGANVLYIGKADGEYIATGYDDLLGPLSVSIQRKASEGGYNMAAIATEQGAFYVARNRREINFLIYNERNGQSSSVGVSSTSHGFLDDLSVAGGGFAGDTAVNQLLWYAGGNLLIAHLNNAPSLVALTYNDSVNSFAWAEMPIAGAGVLGVAQTVNDGTLWLLTIRGDSTYIERLTISSDLARPETTATGYYSQTRNYLPLDFCFYKAESYEFDEISLIRS